MTAYLHYRGVEVEKTTDFTILVLFSIGSLVTAVSYDLPSMVVGRFLQGVGGGGLVPATLALVADLYPPQRRGVPLGVVSAVQEIGSVLGPLFGAAVLAVADWRAIFAFTQAPNGNFAFNFFSVLHGTRTSVISMRQSPTRRRSRA